MSFYIIIPVLISMVFYSLLVLSGSFICFIILSGLKGRGHNGGPTYISGFGAHHPGGLFLSVEERKALRGKSIKREFIISY